MSDELQVLLVYFDGNQRDYIDKLKLELSRRDDSIEVFNLADVKDKPRYADQPTFDKKLMHCLQDCNRVFLVTSEEMKKAVDKNEFPAGSQMENARNIFIEFIENEKNYSKERSKIILIDLFNETSAPLKLEHLDFVKNLFAGERNLKSFDKKVLDIIWSKCKFTRADATPKEKGPNKCKIS